MNRVTELYKIIKDAEEELAEIRDNCTHLDKNIGNYMSRPGRFDTGYICDDCGEFLGDIKSAKEWIKNPQYRLGSGEDFKNNEDYLLSCDYSDDKLSWQQFVKLVDYNNVSNNTKKWLKAKHRDKQIDNILKIEVGDLIQEPGKPIVRCVKILDNDLLWESLDGKSSACDSIIEFNLVTKNESKS
jgi:hypothetical protein